MVQKLFVVFFILNLCFKIHAQIKESEYNCRRDSVISETNYGSVYITKDKSCVLYNWLFPDPEYWMKENGIKTNFPNLANSLSSKFSLWENANYWNSLYEYHDNYYVYGPSDWMSNRPIFLTDSFLIELNSDFSFFPIMRKQLVNSNELFLILDQFGKETQLRIRMLSYPKGAALWECTSNGETMTQLYISNKFVREYHLINNDCVNQKCFQEFKFDKIDLKKLKFLN